MITIVKVIIAACVIAGASWLSERRPEVAGFIIALPLASILALAFSYMEYRNPEASIQFAKSILIGVPISYLFFIPFFFEQKFRYGFLGSYVIGLFLLLLGFLLHQWIMSTFFN
jgi:hypothetical protein